MKYVFVAVMALTVLVIENRVYADDLQQAQIVDNSICTGVCSIYAPDAKTVIESIEVQAYSKRDLRYPCAKAAGYWSHPWSVEADPSCQN